MDVPAHALWTNIVWRLAKQPKKTALWAAFFGILPDLIAFGYFVPMLIFRTLFFGENYPNLEKINGTYQFVQSRVPEYIHVLYNFSHSLVVFLLLFILIAIIRRGNLYLPILAWPLHILIDIFTHGPSSFPTPYLFPFHSPFLGLTGWANFYFLSTNYLAIVIVYIWFYLFYKKKYLKHSIE